MTIIKIDDAEFDISFTKNSELNWVSSGGFGIEKNAIDYCAGLRERLSPATICTYFKDSSILFKINIIFSSIEDESEFIIKWCK